MKKNPFNFSKAEFHTKYFGLLWVKYPQLSSCVNPWAFFAPPLTDKIVLVKFTKN